MMITLRRNDLFSGLMLILCCSLVPTGARVLISSGHDRPPVQAGMLLGASIAGGLFAFCRREPRPSRAHVRRLLLLAAAGCLASLGYFQVVFKLGAADADWIENSLFSVLLVVFAWRHEGHRIPLVKLGSIGLVLAGYVVFLVPHSADPDTLIGSAICWPLVGPQHLTSSVVLIFFPSTPPIPQTAS